MSSNQQLSQNTISILARYAIATLVLTSIHHAYGAYVYSTPWRLHAVYVSIVTSVIILGAAAIRRKAVSTAARNLATAIFLIAVIAIPILFIGLFEAFYNHVAKNIFYFGGASAGLMSRLFPPPTYELPNDVFFEVTGILQVIPAAFTALNLFDLVRSFFKSKTQHIVPGASIDLIELRNILGQAVRIPGEDKLIHLQFRRFAGCPVCNMHLRSFNRRKAEIIVAGIREVVVFHSSFQDLLKYEKELPFDVIADPQKELYRKFGVETSVRAVTDPRVWTSIVKAVAHSAMEVIKGRRPLPPLAPAGGSLGLPADFLIDKNGVVLESKYGVHADDQWSVDELLGSAKTVRVVQTQNDSEVPSQTSIEVSNAYAVMRDQCSGQPKAA